MVGNFVDLDQACEESIVDYLISTVDPLQTTASYYTGFGNIEELQAPAVMVSCRGGSETFYNSKVYNLQVGVTVKQMAADTSSGSLGTLGANIFNALCNPSLKTAINTNNSRSFASQFIQILDRQPPARSGDTLYSETLLSVIGSLSGSL